MKLETTDGEKLAILGNIMLMQFLRDKGILTTEEIYKINELAKIALMSKKYDDFQEEMK